MIAGSCLCNHTAARVASDTTLQTAGAPSLVPPAPFHIPPPTNRDPPSPQTNTPPPPPPTPTPAVEHPRRLLLPRCLLLLLVLPLLPVLRVGLELEHVSKVPACVCVYIYIYIYMMAWLVSVGSCFVLLVEVGWSGCRIECWYV